MTKKYILAGAIAAFFAATQIAYAPATRPEQFCPPKERVIARESSLERFARENEGKLHSLNEEIIWMKSDGIYQKVTRMYAKLNVPVYITRKFVRCLGHAESSDNPQAVSKKGARGWGQFMEKTWHEVGEGDYEKNSFNLEKSIEATIKYILFLDRSLRRLNHNWKNLSYEEKAGQIAAAYNGGIGTLRKAGWDISKMKDETQDYIPRIKKIAEEIAPQVSLFQ